MKRAGLSEADQTAWAAYARHVRLLPGTPTPPEPPAPPPPPAPIPLAKPLHKREAVMVGERPAGLDGSSWNRLQSGKLLPARRIDLHGRTVQQAFHALTDFLHRARADRLRCVEVITGRGSGEHGGAIRRELPLWLNLPAIHPMVLAVTHPHPRNPGSVLILLRRSR